MDSDSSISSRSCSVSAQKSVEITSESFQTPSQSAKKKIFRSTNAQIVLDNMKKMSEKSAKVEAQKESKLTTLGLNKLETKAETKSESAATSIEIAQEVEYRERRDRINQERYMTEQRRLSETRQDNKEIQKTFASIFIILINKL